MDHLKLTDSRLGESSEAIRARVERAREVQHRRFAGSAGTSTHADMRPANVRVHWQLDEASTHLVRAAMAQLQLSARAFHRILKLGRTIADLADVDAIQPAHVAAGQGQDHRAARLFGAGQALRQAIHFPPSPTEVAEYRPRMETTREALGEAAFEAAWAEGQHMTIEQAADYALSEDGLSSQATVSD